MEARGRPHNHYYSVVVLSLFLFASFSAVLPSHGAAQPTPFELPQVDSRGVMAICREIDNFPCALGWVLQLDEGSYLRADSALLRPDSWARDKNRFLVRGSILSYSESQKRWNSVDVQFLGCHNPTAQTSSSLFPGTIYLDCGDANYAFRRTDVETGYTCLRFSFVDVPQQLFWACIEEGPVSQPMIDLSLRESHNLDAVSRYGALTWTLTVANERIFRSDANHVVLNATLPLNVEVQNVTSSQGSCQALVESSIRVVCALGVIRNGDTATTEITLALGPDFHSSSLSATATVEDQESTFDPVLSNNTAAITVSADPSTFVVSPLCTASGDSITLSGLALDTATLEEDDVQVGEPAANILAASGTGLVVEVPTLPDGVYAVTVKGVQGSARVTVGSSCGERLPSLEDVQAGFITGEVLIFLKAGLNPQEIEQFRREYGFQSLIEYPLLGFYRAMLGDTLPRAYLQEEDAPVSCRQNKRATAPEVDLLLLIDRSGTMDESQLKPLLVELSHQMYCLLNRGSRVAVMAYNHEAKLELPFDAWSATQYDALARWIHQPLQAASKSDLSLALTVALDALQANTQPNVSKHILVLTRGPAYPPVKDLQSLIDRANQRGVTIHGFGMVNSFYTPRGYEGLQRIAQGTGRDVTLWDENQKWTLPDVVTRTLVHGVYGIARCADEECLTLIPTVLADLPQQTEDVLGILNRDSRVDEAFFNNLVDTLQADPHLLDEDWLIQLGFPRAWDEFFPHRGAGVTIAVIDTGADLNLTKSASPELVLSPLAPEGLNFAPVPAEFKRPLGQDELGHGTAVSTIATASLGNEVNGAGVAPQATLIPMKVFAVVGGEVKSSNEAVAQALMSAFSLGVDVVNMSLGCYGCSSSTESALRKYYDRVINNLLQKSSQFKGKVPVIVAASGNDGEAWIDSPAAHPFVIAVGSVKPDFSGRSAFSNYGQELDFVALGENTQTTIVGGGFGDAGSGTSFAAPQVAGLAALILAEEPGLSLDAVKTRIRQCFTVDIGPPGFDEETGWGRIWIPTLAEANPECVKKR